MFQATSRIESDNGIKFYEKDVLFDDYKYNDDIEVEMIDAKYFSKDEGNTWELNEDSSLRLKLPTMIPRSEFIIK